MRSKVFLMLVSTIFLFRISASAKDYDLSEVQIKAAISAEGTLKIEESRTYQFRGSFSWADYRLPLDKLGQVRNFQLYEGDVQFGENPDHLPGTYSLTQSPDEFNVRWYYQARDEIRTFTLEYEITDAVKVYNDVAEFYFKFVGEDNPQSIAKVEIWLDLPQGVDTSLVRAWAHGSLHGYVNFQDNRLHYYIAPLPANNYWEARVIFPKNWIAGPTNHFEENHLLRALDEEKTWTTEANQKREQAIRDAEHEKRWADTARKLGLTLCAAAIIVWLFLFINYGRPVVVPYTSEIDPNYPHDLPPAIVSALYYDKQVYAPALSSTLFDLARKGFIALEQQAQPEKKWWQFKADRFRLKLDRNKFNQERSGLLDFENDLLQFLFDRLGAGTNELDAKVIKKHPGKVRAWFRKWAKLLKGHYHSIPLYDASSSRATVISAAFSVLVIIAGGLLAIYLAISALLAVLGGAICFGLSFTIFRYTPDMKLKKKQWRAFRRYIKTYPVSSRDAGLKMSTINQYLVYALALGLGEKEFRKVLAIVPENEYPAYFPWFIASSHGTSPAGNLATTMSAMINIASSTISSAAGVGGGASAGAGAGAGGAAGGAG